MVGNVKYEEENLVKFQEEDEDKEQNSPVSVLDPPFEDDYEGHEENGYDNVECSYAFIHKAQQELLHRLHRFEKLSELDPIELEKRLIEDEEEYALEHAKEFEQTQAHDFMQVNVKKHGIKRLISDLIIEEECEQNSSEEQVIKRVCKRLDSWKEVESNTIDIMVEMDLRREIGNWNKSQKEVDETAMDIEVAIFSVLVDELVEALE
ncbi:Sodium-dependent phosphate transport protein 2C [Bienertia sinuspersici]